MTKVNFRESQLFFLFERNKNIRKNAFLFEDILRNDFIVPFLKISNISDEDNPDIVRLQTISLNKFSNLSITQNKLLLQTSYSSEFQVDLDKIKNYLLAKSKIFREILSNEQLQFFGIVFLFDIELKQEEIVDFLKERTGTNIIGEDTIDFSYSYAKKYQENYFINATIGKFSYLKGEIIQDNNGKVQEENLENLTGVAINLDFNNKLGFLNKKSIVFDDINNFLDVIFRLLEQNSFNDFLKGSIK